MPFKQFNKAPKIQRYVYNIFNKYMGKYLRKFDTSMNKIYSFPLEFVHARNQQYLQYLHSAS